MFLFVRLSKNRASVLSTFGAIRMAPATMPCYAAKGTGAFFFIFHNLSTVNCCPIRSARIP